jgi:predicted metal-dependent phosphoesterase TrpH
VRDGPAPRPKGAARHEHAETRGKPGGRQPVVPPAPSAIDLHSHTLRSDGLLEPLELVTAAAAAGVRLLAVTDHDTLAGYRELKAGGSGSSPPVPAGLELLPGVELNAVMGDRPELVESEVHVIGLGVDPDDAAFEATLQRQRDERRVRFGKMVDRLRELGLPIESALETLPTAGDEDALGRPTLARAMMAMGYTESVEDSFVRYLSRGRPAYVPRGGLGPIEAIAAIRSARGVPVLAHFAEGPERRDLLAELIDAGLRGIEVYHASYDAPTVERLKALAAELRLLESGGSDYHGDRETYAEAHARIWVPPTVEGPLSAAMAAAHHDRVGADRRP